MTDKALAFEKGVRGSKGRIFVCRFIKKDGTLREMRARTGVTKEITGEGLRYNPRGKGIKPVWDIAKRSWRMVNYETMSYFKCGSTVIEIT